MSGLRRTLGLAGLTFFAVGMILGAGIYSVIGEAAAPAGEALWLSFLLGAVAALLTGLSYAELATMFPKAGAEYVYLRAAVPKARWPASLAGLILVFAAAATATTVARAFGGYLHGFVPVPPWIAAAGLLLVTTSMNLTGIRESARMNVVFTLVEVAGLVLVVVFGSGSPDFGDALGAPPSWGVLGGAALVFFAYLGFEDVANLVEEAEDPSRDLPRAIVGSVLVTAVLYVLVALAAVALIPVERLSASQAPLADAVAARSSWGARVLGAVALFATANTALIAQVSASRMLYGMASDRGLPAFLGAVSGRGVPWTSALLVSGMALALLPLGTLGTVASLSSAGALLGFAAVNAAVIVLRRREPGRKRPFRVPLAVRGVPVLAVLGGLAAIGLATRFEPSVYVALAVAAAASGLLLVLHRSLGSDRR